MIAFRLMGPMARYTGYSVGFRGLVSKLRQRRDLDFQLRATKGHLPPETETEFTELIAKNGYYDRLGVAVGFADMMADLVARYGICYTMYETDDIPEHWKHHVSRANEVWVPSSFCAKVFGKYNKHIRVVPWGIDDAVFKPGKRRKTCGEYVFGSVGVQSHRKGTDVMLKAFQLAFGGRPGVRLIIKTRDTKHLPLIDNAMVDVIDSDWEESRLVQFYRDMDCFVGPSRGEGIFQGPLQAVMCGTPAITTNWSGMTDYINGEGVWGINVKGLVQCGKGMMAPHARWAEPDEKHLAELMQWAVETRPNVTGDYSRWGLENMSREFVKCLEYSWGQACRR